MEPVFKKPTVDKMNERCKVVLEFLQQQSFVTKPEIARLLNWTYPKHDRQIRDIIATISQKHPIISCSDNNNGYKLAKDIEDGELVKQSWAEIDSRIEELTKRKRPLVKFMDRFNLKITLFD